MKKFIFVFVCIAMTFAQSTKAQNIQELYDFGRGHFTTTLEMFKNDNWGSTFYFTDIYHIQQNCPTGYYTEIARSLNFWKNTGLKDLSLHAEWNGGQFASNSWLFGLEYLLHNDDYSYTITFELLYKMINTDVTLLPYDKANNVPLQLTAVWVLNDLLDVAGLTFSGFLDFWWENNNWDQSGLNPDITTCTLLAEPQIWYNVGQHFDCENLNIGGELEIAYNFSGSSPESWANRKGFNMAPCLGIKWNF